MQPRQVRIYRNPDETSEVNPEDECLCLLEALDQRWTPGAEISENGTTYAVGMRALDVWRLTYPGGLMLQKEIAESVNNVWLKLLTSGRVVF